MALQKLVLGSAQWGLNYGVSNTLGKTSPGELLKIAEVANKYNLNHIDTASAYGDSHSMIAKYFSAETKVITKLPAIGSASICEQEFANKMNIYLNDCMKSLNRRRLYGLLIHDTKDLEGNYSKQLIDFLSSIKKAGLVSKIGVSIYSEEDLCNACNLYDWDLIQVPFNVFDQRFKNNSHIEKFRRRGGEIYARSIFLQGLLLSNPHQIPIQLRKWLPQLSDWHIFCKRIDMSSLQACISLAFNEDWIDYCILGIAASSQLEENIRLIKDSIPINCEFLAQRNSLELIDPRSWKL